MIRASIWAISVFASVAWSVVAVPAITPNFGAQFLLSALGGLALGIAAGVADDELVR